MRGGQRLGLQVADMGAPADLAPDEAGGFERLDVFRGGGEGNGIGLRKV